jgi:hypothetical protein
MKSVKLVEEVGLAESETQIWISGVEIGGV